MLPINRAGPPISVRIHGIPYAQAKTTGRKDGCAEWTEAVKSQTRHLRPVAGACRVRVVFFLPPDKYPTDYPHGMDLDNLLKRFFDALNETVFQSIPGKDSCVTELDARKVRVAATAEAGAELEIHEIAR
jgi:Holliday junction resolvase RusA-like endonuclease